MKNIIKVLIITAFSLNLLQAKATLSIDGYMPKMLFMKVKDGGTVYVDDEKKGMTSANGPLIVQIQEGEHNVKVCFPNEKNNMLRICGEQKVYVANDTQANVSIKAERSQSMTDLEKCQDGDFKICAELGDAEKDHKKAAQLYEKACDGGIMDGCNSLGLAYGDGKGVAKDVKMIKDGKEKDIQDFFTVDKESLERLLGQKGIIDTTCGMSCLVQSMYIFNGKMYVDQGYNDLKVVPYNLIEDILSDEGRKYINK